MRHLFSYLPNALAILLIYPHKAVYSPSNLPSTLLPWSQSLCPLPDMFILSITDVCALTQGSAPYISSPETLSLIILPAMDPSPVNPYPLTLLFFPSQNLGLGLPKILLCISFFEISLTKIS